MRAALVIARKDLKQRFRDRSAIIVGFVAPLGIALIISNAFGSGFGDSFSATYAVVDADGTDLSKAFATQVLGSPQLKDNIAVVRPRSEAAAREVVDRDGAAAAFVIPKGFQAAATANRKVDMKVLRNPDALVGGPVAVAIAEAFTDQINAARLAVSTTIRMQGAGPDPAVVADLARAAAAERIPIQLADRNPSVREVGGANYFGPAMAMFFLFFTTGFAARSLLAEREQGTLPRILASPISRSSVVVGKALSGFLLGVASMAVIFIAMKLMLGVDWGDPLALIVLTVLTVLAVMTVTAVVQLAAKTQEQADAFGNAVAVTFGLVGGNFFPIFQLPELIQRVSLVTPNGWALRGYTDIAYDGATLADLLPNIAVIGAFAVVMGTIAFALSRKLSVR